MRLLKLALLFALFVAPAEAKRNYYSSDSTVPVTEVQMILTSGQSWTSVEYKIDNGEVQAMDWTFSTTPTRVNVIFLQSNVKVGPYTEWSRPSMIGENPTNRITITTKQDGCGINLTPSVWTKVKIHNLDTNTVTPTRLTIINQ
jgi:hypothetical protein